jgi:hypothetical protein
MIKKVNRQIPFRNSPVFSTFYVGTPVPGCPFAVRSLCSEIRYLAGFQLKLQFVSDQGDEFGIGRLC